MVFYGVVMILLGAYASIKNWEPGSLGGVAAGGIVLGMTAWSLKNPRPAYIISLLIGLAVAGRFVGQFMKTQLIYPHGVIAALNIFLIVALLGGHLLSMAKPKSEESSGN